MRLTGAALVTWLLVACDSSRVDFPAPPPDVRWVAALGFTDGELVSATPIRAAALGRGPRDVSASAAEGWALLGWRDTDGLDPAAVDGPAVELASGPSVLTAPSFGLRAVASHVAEDFVPWADPPALTVEGLRPCPVAVPEGAHLSLSCGTDTCDAQIRQVGCDLALDAEGCGFTDLSGRVRPDGAIEFDEGTPCTAALPDAPGAASTLRCMGSGTSCAGHVMRPGGPSRVFVQRRRLFSPSPPTIETLGGGWMAEPSAQGARVVVLQRATPERAACATAGPATLHLLEAETLQVARTATVAGCTWRVRMLATGEILTFEGGTDAAVQRWSADLEAGPRWPVTSLVGGAFFPSASDRNAGRVMVLWDDLDEQGPLARATRVDADGTLTTVELDTRRVGAVALRPDGRFILLDNTDRRVSLHALVPGGREDSYRVGIHSRPLRALVHHPERFETWLAVGGAVSPQVFVTGPGDFRSTPRVTGLSEVSAEPWTIARWPSAPHRALAAFVERSGAGPAHLGLVDPGLDPPVVLRGLTEVGMGPVVGGEADERGRVWLGLPAEGTVLRVEPW